MSLVEWDAEMAPTLGVEGAEHVQMFRGKGGEQDYWGWVQRVWGLGIGVGEK